MERDSYTLRDALMVKLYKVLILLLTSLVITGVGHYLPNALVTILITMAIQLIFNTDFKITFPLRDLSYRLRHTQIISMSLYYKIFFAAGVGFMFSKETMPLGYKITAAILQPLLVEAVELFAIVISRLIAHLRTL